jgi:hypothetical protein
MAMVVFDMVTDFCQLFTIVPLPTQKDERKRTAP